MQAFRRLNEKSLAALLSLLREQGFTVIGPTARDQAIVYDEISGLGDLPRGWTERADAGSYRLERRSDDALFGFTVGPHSWKKFLHPAQETIWKAEKVKGRFKIDATQHAERPLAFLGVRPCDLASIGILDRVLLRGAYIAEHYRRRRENIFIIAVNCTEAGGTCFCAAMGSGPAAESGFDLALTEVLTGGEHYFVAEIGSEAGERLVRQLSVVPVKEADLAAARAATDRARSHMGRTLETAGLKELLQRNLDHPRWSEIAGRCLSCANCTMACPTCFCTTIEDRTDLTGTLAVRERKWDSCFTAEFSQVHGGRVRGSTKSRYRQWLTHKFASWQDQFGTFGCVGCGRCITWCPVGIDVTAELEALREKTTEATS